MSDTSELERQNAELRKQLEAAQAASAGGLMGALSPLLAVAALVPRWLVVAGGVVLLSWSSAEMYLGIREKIAAVRQIEAQSCQTRYEAIMNLAPISDALTRATPEYKKWEQDCREYTAADSKPPVPPQALDAAPPARQLSFWEKVKITESRRKLEDYTSFGTLVLVCAVAVLLMGISRAWVRFLWVTLPVLAGIEIMAMSWSLAVVEGVLVAVTAAALYRAERFWRETKKQKVSA